MNYLTDSSTIFFAHIPIEYTEDDVRKIFSPFGKIKDLLLLQRNKKNKSRCCGWIKFESEQMAINAEKALNNKSIIPNRSDRFIARLAISSEIMDINKQSKDKHDIDLDNNNCNYNLNNNNETNKNNLPLYSQLKSESTNFAIKSNPTVTYNNNIHSVSSPFQIPTYNNSINMMSNYYDLNCMNIPNYTNIHGVSTFNNRAFDNNNNHEISDLYQYQNTNKAADNVLYNSVVTDNSVKELSFHNIVTEEKNIHNSDNEINLVCIRNLPDQITADQFNSILYGLNSNIQISFSYIDSRLNIAFVHCYSMTDALQIKNLLHGSQINNKILHSSILK